MKIHDSKTYELRNISRCMYAYIILTDLQESVGMLNIISDYGNWSYMWGGMGSDIRSFLCRINTDYLMDKLTIDKPSDREHFNFEKTVDILKSKIIDLRRCGELSKEYARELYDEAKALENNSNTINEFYLSLPEELQDFYHEYQVHCYTEYSPMLKAFANDVWPKFIKVLKDE